MMLALWAIAPWLLAIGTVSGTTVRVVTPSPVHAGYTFSAQVYVESVTDLYGAQFSLSFNPAVLQANSVGEGPFLKGPIQNFSTFWYPPTIDNNAGTITGALVSRLGNTPGATGSGTIATISFYAKIIGSSTLSLTDVALSDSYANPISFTATDGSVSISPPPSPPETLIVDGPTGTIPTTTATFIWSGQDSDGFIASYQYRIDSQAWITTAQTSHTFTGLSKGSHTFYVAATDNDGLTDSTPASRSFTVYYTANPETAIVSGPNGTVEGNTATFQWIGTDVDGRVDHYLCRLDNQTWTLTTRTNLTYTDLAYGSHTFRVKAVDNEGLEDLTPEERAFTLVPYWWEEEIDRLNQTIGELQGQLQAAQAAQAALEEERERLEGQVESLQGQVESLQGQVESLQGNLGTLQREKAALQTQIQDMESQKNQLNAEINELEKLSAELEADNADLAQRLNSSEERYRALSREMTGLTTQLGDKDRELQQTRADLDKAQRDIVTLQGEVGSLGNQTATLQKQIQELNSGMSELTRAKESLEAENEALKREGKAAQEENSALQEEIDSLEAELLAAQQQTASAVSQIAEKQSEIDALEAEKNADIAGLEEKNKSLVQTRQILIAVLAAVAILALALLALTMKHRRSPRYPRYRR